MASKKRAPLGAKWILSIVFLPVACFLGFWALMIAAWGTDGNNTVSSSLRIEMAPYKNAVATHQKLDRAHFSYLSISGEYGGGVLLRATLTDQTVADPTAWYENSLQVIEESGDIAYRLELADDTTPINIDLAEERKADYELLSATEDVKPLINQAYELAYGVDESYYIDVDLLAGTVEQKKKP